MSTTRTSGIPSSTRNWMMANPTLMRALPHPEERWQLADTDLHQRALPMLRRYELIEQVGSDEDQVNIYRTREHYWEAIQDSYDESAFLDCGHRPFRTVDTDAEQPYSCTDEDCDARYSRGQIEAVINGGGSA